MLRNLVGAILGLPYQTVGNGGGKSGVLGVDSELLYATTDDRKDWAGPVWGKRLATPPLRAKITVKRIKHAPLRLEQFVSDPPPRSESTHGKPNVSLRWYGR